MSQSQSSYAHDPGKIPAGKINGYLAHFTVLADAHMHYLLKPQIECVGRAMLMTLFIRELILLKERKTNPILNSASRARLTAVPVTENEKATTEIYARISEHTTSTCDI